MERAEAEAVFDAGREVCVEFLLELAVRTERETGLLNERVARLEETGQLQLQLHLFWTAPLASTIRCASGPRDY